MRLNKFIAAGTGMSRRAADSAINDHRVLVNGKTPELGQDITDADNVMVDGRPVTPLVTSMTIMLNKPTGYVASRAGQGSKTIYDLLPAELHHLKPVGRLDKDSSGLLLLSNDGDLHYRLTHPSFEKEKIYEVKLHRELVETDYHKITRDGIALEDGLSKLQLDSINRSRTDWRVRMHEGRNHQIRRTFKAITYTVVKLHRVQFGDYTLGDLPIAKFRTLL
jgi:23S rRNA pseudouridine2605 synthase